MVVYLDGNHRNDRGDGSDRKPALEVLQEALKDSSPTVVEAAKEAIDKLQGDDDDDEEPQKVNKPAVKKKPQF